jgi:hypothetical protein
MSYSCSSFFSASDSSCPTRFRRSKPFYSEAASTIFFPLSGTRAMTCSAAATISSVPASEQPGNSPSCPNTQPEWPSSPRASRRSFMLLLWRTKPLGEELSKESSSVSANSQCPSKTRSAITSTRSPWLGLQPWKGEPPRGQSNLGCSGRGSRYVSSRILPSKSII